jgi:hypothetical protein
MVVVWNCTLEIFPFDSSSYCIQFCRPTGIPLYPFFPPRVAVSTFSLAISCKQRARRQFGNLLWSITSWLITNITYPLLGNAVILQSKEPWLRSSLKVRCVVCVVICDVLQAWTQACLSVLTSRPMMRSVEALVQLSYRVHWDGWPEDHPFVPFGRWPSGKLSDHSAVVHDNGADLQWVLHRMSPRHVNKVCHFRSEG